VIGVASSGLVTSISSRNILLDGSYCNQGAITEVLRLFFILQEKSLVAPEYLFPFVPKMHSPGARSPVKIIKIE
jgi:hypothetical protein